MDPMAVEIELKNHTADLAADLGIARVELFRLGQPTLPPKDVAQVHDRARLAGAVLDLATQRQVVFVVLPRLPEAALLMQDSAYVADDVGLPAPESQLPAEPYRLVHQQGHTEVHELDVVLFGDQDVLGLHVAMDDARAVDRGEPLADLARHVATEFLGDAVHLAAQGRERLPLHVLHHQEAVRRAVAGQRLTTECANDVGMTESRAHLGLAPKALQEPGGFEEMRVNDLQGDGRAHLDTRRRRRHGRGVDGPHASRAELSFDGVGTERRAHQLLLGRARTLKRSSYLAAIARGRRRRPFEGPGAREKVTGQGVRRTGRCSRVTRGSARAARVRRKLQIRCINRRPRRITGCGEVRRRLEPGIS